MYRDTKYVMVSDSTLHPIIHYMMKVASFLTPKLFKKLLWKFIFKPDHISKHQDVFDDTWLCDMTITEYEHVICILHIGN